MPYRARLFGLLKASALILVCAYFAFELGRYHVVPLALQNTHKEKAHTLAIECIQSKVNYVRVSSALSGHDEITRQKLIRANSVHQLSCLEYEALKSELIYFGVDQSFFMEIEQKAKLRVRVTAQYMNEYASAFK